MKKLAVITGVCFILFFTPTCKKKQSDDTPSLPADQSSFTSATVINQRLGRGVNLGDTYESSWAARESNPADFRRIAEIGLKHVRIPIRWELSARSMYSSPYTITTSFLAKIKSVVDEALKNKLHVILNMHHHDSLFANPDGMKPMFLAQWQQISNYFKDYPDSLLFEVLNEPHGQLDAQRWNTFFSDALKEIRKTNPKRTVLLGVAEWGGVAAVNKLVIPNDNQLILTIHYYNPFTFTHQGASWVAGSDAWLGTKWHDTEYERLSVENEFKTAIQFAKDKNIPVHIGEFGAFSTADMDSRTKWTRFLSRWFEQQGFSWAYWEFNSGFGIYDPATGQYRTPLLNALTKDAMTAPTPTTLTDLYSSNFANSQTDGWNLYNNDASVSSTMSVVNSRINVTITAAGTQNWYIQLIRHNTLIEAGKTYRVVFNAYSNTNRSISATVMQSSPPWTIYGNGDFNITATDASYSFVFTATTTDAISNFLFSLGNSGTSPVTLYNIKLQEVKF
jgi:aryl-phospho-beta-D-glucosidase BglC (GH1 family)